METDELLRDTGDEAERYPPAFNIVYLSCNDINNAENKKFEESNFVADRVPQKCMILELQTLLLFLNMWFLKHFKCYSNSFITQIGNKRSLINS